MADGMCAPGHEAVTNPDGLQQVTTHYITTAVGVLAKERAVHDHPSLKSSTAWLYQVHESCPHSSQPLVVY